MADNNTFDATDFLSNPEDVVDSIYNMIDEGGELGRCPREKDILLVREKRKLIHNELKDRLDKFSFVPGKSSALTPRQAKQHQNVKYFRITEPLIANIKICFLEVTARVIAGGGQFSLVPNMVNNIYFGDDLQPLIETKLIQPLLDDLQHNHKVELEKSEQMSVKMYVNRHQKGCRLPCEKILKDKPDFTRECLGQRIPLGSYFAPFISNDDTAGEGDSWGILDRLIIKNNSWIYGLGNPHNEIDKCHIFTDDNIAPPAHCIISFKFHEIGVCNKKPILYIHNEDKCYYSYVKTNEIRSARSIIPLILREKPDIKKMF